MTKKERNTDSKPGVFNSVLIYKVDLKVSILFKSNEE
jgi:hypothetical protein